MANEKSENIAKFRAAADTVGGVFEAEMDVTIGSIEPAEKGSRVGLTDEVNEEFSAIAFSGDVKGMPTGTAMTVKLTMQSGVLYVEPA